GLEDIQNRMLQPDLGRISVVFDNSRSAFSGWAADRGRSSLTSWVGGPARQWSRRNRRSGGMADRDHVAKADRVSAECKNRISRQREIIATAYENGHFTDIHVSMLRALEENLRSFERHRHLILDQLKNADRQRLARTASQSSVRN